MSSLWPRWGTIWTLRGRRVTAGKFTLRASTATTSFPPRSSCSVTLKVSTLPGSPPRSVISVNCPSKQIKTHEGQSQSWQNALCVPCLQLQIVSLGPCEARFRMWHGNVNNLLCLFCLEIFKLMTSFVDHAWRHWNKRVFPCSKCWLQCLNLKEKTEHQTKNHQSFKKPEQLWGLPPEAEVMIQTSVQLGLRETASIIVRNTDSQVPPRKTTKKIDYEHKIFHMCCSKGSG